jgi:steroid delta-isomerase-like uncharacterized protein
MDWRGGAARMDGPTMDSADMQTLVSNHLSAEGRGDVDAAIAVYTDEIEHDMVGFPGGVKYGKDAARKFYEHLTTNFRSEREDDLHRYVTEGAMILEQLVTGVVTGSLLGMPGNGRTISFRTMHVVEFSDGLISRENVWLDTAAIVRQLS